MALPIITTLDITFDLQKELSYWFLTPVIDLYILVDLWDEEELTEMVRCNGEFYEITYLPNNMIGNITRRRWFGETYERYVEAAHKISLIDTIGTKLDSDINLYIKQLYVKSCSLA